MRATVLATMLLVSISTSAQLEPTCTVRDPDLQGTYEGDCVAGFASGKGRAIGKDRYEGNFRDGYATGYGIYTRPSGQRAEGEFVDGKLNGRAKIYMSNGDILEGQFSDGRLSGIGKIARKSGGVLDVELRDGKLVRTTAGTTTTSGSMPPQTSQGTNGENSSNIKWAPVLDLESIFPSYILASATRKELPASPTTHASRGDPLSALAGFILAVTGNEVPQSASSNNIRYLGDRWGTVGVHVRTTVPNSEVVVAISIDEIAEPTSSRFILDNPGEYFLYPKLKYRYDKLRAVTQPMPVNISWRLTVNGTQIGNQLKAATLRSVYDAPIQAQTSRGSENLSWVFSAYVTEDEPWIDVLLKNILQHRSIRQFVGYQAGPQEVHRQVAAVYEELQRMGVRYSNIATSSQVSNRVFSQAVRLPLDSIKNVQANCIDGTVLMASVLRKIGLDAWIILGPGHAMLGYTETGNPQQGLTIVETTMVGNARFSDAVRAGNARYNEWANSNPRDPRFQHIRVADARQQGVMPISH
jgi:hypothetical protein